MAVGVTNITDPRGAQSSGLDKGIPCFSGSNAFTAGRMTCCLCCTTHSHSLCVFFGTSSCAAVKLRGVHVCTSDALKRLLVTPLAPCTNRMQLVLPSYSELIAFTHDHSHYCQRQSTWWPAERFIQEWIVIPQCHAAPPPPQRGAGVAAC